MKRPWHKLSSIGGIDYIQKQKSVKVNTERLGDLDRFPFPNGLLVMSVEELKRFQKFGVNFDCTFIDISISNTILNTFFIVNHYNTVHSVYSPYAIYPQMILKLAF